MNPDYFEGDISLASSNNPLASKMKVCNADDRIHVLDAGVSPYQTLVDICESGVQEDSFFVCDVDEIIRKFKEWTLLMPRVHPHYAVKCNDSSTVLEVLAALGTGFDCATKVNIAAASKTCHFLNSFFFLNLLKI